MASKATEIVTKRSIKPKTQYSPSNIPTTTRYHLVIYDDTDFMTIVGNSSIKRLENDGTMLLNNGRTAKLIISGTKDKCIEQWNKQTRPSKNNNNDEQVQGDDDDDAPDLVEQTLQAPTNTFSTPAPYRRQKTFVRRSSSPDSIISVPSSKRVAYEDRLNCSAKRQTNALSSRNSNRVVKVVPPIMSSSEDEEITDAGDVVSLNRLFEELQNTQANIRDTRTENRGIQQQLMNLTKKISRFSSLLISKTDNDLDRYRDSNNEENFEPKVMYKGDDLLEIGASNAGEYARNLLKILFTQEELKTSLLPSQQSKRYSKPELDHERFKLLNDAVRTRYRISKNYYYIFYKERIQETLAGCIYNAGTRKSKNQAVGRQQQQNDPEIVQQDVSEVEQ